LLANPSDIGTGLNYLMDTLLLSGSVLALAQGLSGISALELPKPEPVFAQNSS
jgi:hypothetical protein